MFFINALAHPLIPLTYEQIIEPVADDQVIVVSGEQDNTYAPTATNDSEAFVIRDSRRLFWGGWKNYSTGTLSPGTFQFSIVGIDNADLYVRVGKAPNLFAYDCRPHLRDSNETCEITLTKPAEIKIMVRASSLTTKYTLVGRRASY